jgi:undecaprenyl-diphosphatase
MATVDADPPFGYADLMLALLRRSTNRVIHWLGGPDLLLLLGLLALVVGVWGFLQLAGAVRAGETQSLDERLLLALRDPADPAVLIGPPWMGELVRDLTAIGGVAVLFLLTGSVAGFLLLCRKYHALVLLLAIIGGGLLLSTLLKRYIDRPRPVVVPHLSYVNSTSFPSGHSMLSAIVYLTLGSLLARLIRPRRLKLYVLSVALLLTFLVGFSRVCLGVHYPSDVLAGWAAGLAWAVLCWLLTRRLQREGAIEKPMGSPAP